MIGQLLPNRNEMLQWILALQNLELNTALVSKIHQKPEKMQNKFSWVYKIVIRLQMTV
jgi:hypothetical protein